MFRILHILSACRAVCCGCCRWEAHEAEGYKWWAHRMARALQLYDETRIDHFRCAQQSARQQIYWACAGNSHGTLMVHIYCTKPEQRHRSRVFI
jgi:hypothetical protein